MAITKQIVQDKITVDEYGNVMIREATRLIENGEVIGQSFHRRVITPENNISNEPNGFGKDIAEKIHTPSLKAAYQARLAAEAAKTNGNNPQN